MRVQIPSLAGELMRTEALIVLRTLTVSIGLLAGIVSAQTTVLEPGKPVERDIANGETHKYVVKLEPGQLIHMVVTQESVDVAVTVLAPDGKKLTEANRRGSSEDFWLQAEVA